jgi:hypothetical protein
MICTGQTSDPLAGKTGRRRGPETRTGTENRFLRNFPAPESLWELKELKPETTEDWKEKSAACRLAQYCLRSE